LCSSAANSGNFLPMFWEDLSVPFLVFKDPTFLDLEMSTQLVHTYWCKYSISVFLSFTISEIYFLQSPNCKSASSSNMLIQNLCAYWKKVLFRSIHVPLIWVKLKCLSIFVTEYSVPVPYRVWKVSFSCWCLPITEKLKDADWKTQNIRKCLLCIFMLYTQQQTKFLVTSLFADLIFPILTNLIFNFSFSLLFYMRNMYSTN